MRTMTSKAPTVVECPDNGFIRSFKIIEKDLDVYIISVNIMKMNNIGVVLFNPFNKLFSCTFRVKAGVIENSRFKRVDFNS